MPLHPDVALDVHLSAICHRHRYTRHPDEVIAELVAVAGGRRDILARVAGHWAGYFEADETKLLVDALVCIPGATDWYEAGHERRGSGIHGTTGFGRAKSAPRPSHGG